MQILKIHRKHEREHKKEKYTDEDDSLSHNKQE